MTTTALRPQSSAAPLEEQPTEWPPPPRGRHRRTPTRHERRVRTVMLAAVTVQSLVVAWASFRGYFFTDDLVFMGRGARSPWLDPEYLFQPWGGHLMPAAFAVAQVSAKLSEYDYGFVAAGLALGQALVVWLLYRVLTGLFGFRWRLLLPLGMVLLSIPLLQATTWWAAALNMLPFLATLLLAVWAFTARLTGGPPWLTATAFGATLAGLAFFEKAVLVPPLLFLLAVTLSPVRNPLRAAWSVARDHARLWGGFVVTYAVWAWVYLHNDTSEAVSRFNLTDLAERIRSGVAGVFPTSLFGGPWDWQGPSHVAPGYDVANTADWATLAAAVAVAAAAVWVASHGVRARRAMLTALLYLLAVGVLLNIGRQAVVISYGGLPRYYADAVVVFAVLTAFGTARLRHDPWPETLREPSSTRLASPAGVIALVVVADLWLVSAVWSASGLVRHLGSDESRVYLSNAVRGLKALGPGHDVLNLQVPADVLWPIARPYNDYAWFFAPVHDGPRHPRVSDELIVIDPLGTPVPAYVAGPDSRRGPDAGCGYRLGAGATRVPLVARIVPWSHTVRVQYMASATTTSSVRIGDGDPVPVVLEAGLHNLFLQADGGGPTVEIGGISPGVSVCVDRVVVGVPVPGIELRPPDTPPLAPAGPAGGTAAVAGATAPGGRGSGGGR